MKEEDVYNHVNLLQEAKRYKTSFDFLNLLYLEMHDSKQIFLDCLGPRLFTIVSALGKEIHGVDINQGSIDRTYEFIQNWQAYVNEQPFKTEFDFLKSKNLTPKFTNYHFDLTNNPTNKKNEFDAELASELFLHMTESQVSSLLHNASYRLRSGGKLIFTIYPSGTSESLDKKFLQLYPELKLESLVDNSGQINIALFAKSLKHKSPQIYEEEKEEYWLDLQNVRMFDPTEIKHSCEKEGFEISKVEQIRGGMFPFADRQAYVATKKK